MALQGTLDTFALPDVLRLLASTKKSGRILVQGDRGTGSLYLDTGAIVGGETSLAPTDEGHEVLFELLRLGDGSFLFDPADTTSSPQTAAEVEEVISAAESSHDEWKDLTEVVPSLDVELSLAEELPDGSATVDADRWRLIVGIGSGTTVRALGDRLELRELPILRATRGLVDDGLAVIGEATEAPAGSTPSAPAPAALPELDDEPDAEGIFDGAPDEAEELPEPLPEKGGSTRRTADPFGEAADREVAVSGALAESDLPAAEAAILEQQFEQLPTDQRELIERVAEEPTRENVDNLIDELPDGAIDRELLRRFLGSVRA